MLSQKSITRFDNKMWISTPLCGAKRQTVLESSLPLKISLFDSFYWA